MIRKFFSIYIFILIPAVYFLSCEINSPSLPTWETSLSVPFANKSYNIFDIIKRNDNLGADSLNNDQVFIYGESNYRRVFGEDIEFDGINTTNITAPSTLQLDTFIVVDDSTFVRWTEFLDGSLSFTFFNTSNESYTVNASIKNLFKVSDNDTARIQTNVPSNKERTVILNMADYYVMNENLENRLKLHLDFQSSTPVPVNFNYTLTPYSIKEIRGRLKPLNTGVTSDEVLDPFGSDVPEGKLNFASITPNKNFLILKKYSSIYNVDFANISITGENKNGRRVRLKYLRTGNAGDPVDSIFTLTLPAELDSLAFPINESNSNILEFINNIPKKIFLERNDFLNRSYQDGSVRYTDSLTLKFLVQVPLDVSISKPIIFTDTSDVGISDPDQRKNLDDIKNLTFTLNAVNGFPLKITAKIIILDSAFNPILAITHIVGNQPDSTILVAAAPVGQDGYVNNKITTAFTSELDSVMIQQVKRMGKMIYEYKLYTDPNLIPPPLSTVKIKGSDVISTFSFGTIRLRINSDK
ncbi:MAG: hypothetical protein ABI462_15300 [Ignavibacteria bacterium]